MKQQDALPKATRKDFLQVLDNSSHPIDNTWHTALQSPVQDWNPLPDEAPAPDT